MHLLKEIELYKILIKAEKSLFNSEKIKFERTKDWRKKFLKHTAAVYAIFENDKLIYIGETGNLLKRMSDITRTVNHSFRKQIGHFLFSGIKSSKKFGDDIEIKLDKYFDDALYIQFIEVNFGRLEIETYLIDKYKEQVINAPKKRKQKYNYEVLKTLFNEEC
ncbi:GIY-YIG nuclease family protein [Myroides phaeus]|uniref:GIY-YIG nuclease family protein n=1 Tax=Myroides phaeus TaxID=702745 RepID=UPI002DC04B38|nr:GIY-YIG nuclease family protein [Myroides phaeus]MEC4116025.1 GIY-YIG nuclease family protein [Myroides phaeus]